MNLFWLVVKFLVCLRPNPEVLLAVVAADWWWISHCPVSVSVLLFLPFKSTVVGNMKMQIVGLSSGRFGSVSEDQRFTSKCLLKV